MAFEALAGAEQQTLQPGTIAYIGTGECALTWPLQICFGATNCTTVSRGDILTPRLNICICLSVLVGGTPLLVQHIGSRVLPAAGGPVPHGADAVVQIEDTQVVGRTALGAPLVDIKKVCGPCGQSHGSHSGKGKHHARHPYHRPWNPRWLLCGQQDASRSVTWMSTSSSVGPPLPGKSPTRREGRPRCHSAREAYGDKIARCVRRRRGQGRTSGRWARTYRRGRRCWPQASASGPPRSGCSLPWAPPPCRCVSPLAICSFNDLPPRRALAAA